MRRLKFLLAAVLVLCAACLTVHRGEQINDTPVNPDGSINIPSDGSRYIPIAGDSIRCDDETNYTILDASLYVDCGPLPSIYQEWPGYCLPERETIHYRGFSGDYLFVRNLYETRRMVNTLCAHSDRPLRLRLTVPEELPTNTFSPWDPERMEGLAGVGRGDTVCLETWDMFKDGVFYKTIYEIGIDRGEAVTGDPQPEGR
jgi:hypothetical protein